jgi:hypothetical protein
MQLEPLADQAGVAISYDHANDWLYADWYGEHTGETSRVACLLLLEHLRAHTTTRILNDNSRISHINLELSEWSIWWLGEMRAAGLTALAWVYPPIFAARKSADTFMLPITQPLVATFDDLASAYDWLRSQKPSPAPGE